MIGKTVLLCGLLLTLATPGYTCDLCTALSSDKTAFDEYWFPAIGNDPSLGINWKQLSLTETQKRDIDSLEKEWLAQAKQPADKTPENKLQTLLRDSKGKTQEIISTFKEIGFMANRTRENFELRYKVLSREQQESLQHLYKKRDALQAKAKVMRDIARQDLDAGMVLNSKARKRVLCPYAELDRTSAQTSSFLLL
ncbi:MAG: hypothetical protein K2W95_08500 [Candidatus Obscuribacterales bacterium]|nr:hypothetical protein [Candidatus Obscuribacterales bacterium]